MTTKRRQIEDPASHSAGPPRRPWERLRHVVRQHPLIETRPSLQAIATCTSDIAPRAVFVGVGLCSKTQLSRAVPLDLVGMLLAATSVRRALGASRLVVLIADEHALGNGFDASAVERRALVTEGRIAELDRALGLDLTVQRASVLHRCEDYARALAEVPRGDGDYFRREVADILCLNRRLGAIVKVGWTVGRDRGDRQRRDEVAFDRRFRRWIGDHVSFVYCKAGRTLDPSRPKAAPYVALDPSRRICLQPGEDLWAKLTRAERAGVPESIRRAVIRQVKLILRCHDQLFGRRGRGPALSRAQNLIDLLCATSEQVGRGRAASDPNRRRSHSVS